MKSFDDSIPEESTPSYQNLITLLRQSAPDAATVTPEEQVQMLARVRSRLHQADDGSPENEFPATKNPDNAFPSSPLRRKASPRSGSMRRTLNMIAAVLVIGVIAGASLFLFSSHQARNLGSNIPIGAPIEPIKAPVTVRSEAGGLEASLQVTSGPYFLSELLGVTVSFTNHTQEEVLLGGSTSLNSCESAFNAMMTGGSEPHYNFPDAVMSCPLPKSTTFAARKTLTMQGYIHLTSSGQVTITTEAGISVSKGDKNSVGGIKWVSSSLNGHWPAIHINVTAHIPSDRILSLQQQGSKITIEAPVSARSHLVYYNIVTCTGGGTINVSADSWHSVNVTEISEPGCSGSNKHWTYAVSAPGYAIALGEMSP